MSSQTVFRLNKGRGFEGLQECKEPIPAVEKYEVLVKVRSISLNYRDVATVTSKYPFEVKDQVVPCSDMAGEIIGVGDLAEGFSVGDSVIAALSPNYLYCPGHVLDTWGGSRDGMLREYVALPAHAAIKVPKSSSHDFAQWASAVVTGATVWNSFYGNVHLKPGEIVLVLGTGGVSLTALVFAKAAGATVIVTSSSDRKLEYVTSKLGADHTINYKTHPNWADEVRQLTDGKGVDHVIESTGTGTIRQSIESVATGGSISLIGFLAPLTQDQMPDVTLLVMLKGCVVRGILGGSKQQIEEVVKYMGNRNVKIPVDKTFDFNRDDIIAALKYIESGQHIGKVCINLD
ncbi:hypothetical protein GGR54DRAFT_578061 [Hypoxylon sp. NC1633]|nr:hypothetical protein GGR54DRAFT_578061 [Hypoxylon sp. NC1633]